MKRIIKNILTIIPIIVFLFAIYIILSATLSLRNRRVPKIFGYSYMTVESISMEPQIKKYDFIIVKNTKDVQINDVISFYYDVDNDGIIEVNTHKIIAIDGDKITTWGANNPIDKVEHIDRKDVIGKVTFVSTFLGQIFSLNFIKDKRIILGVIIAILLIIILNQIINIGKMVKEERKNKKEV